MRAWPALLLAPLFALGAIGLGYALVPAACEHSRHWIVHAAMLLFLALSLATTALAWGALRVARQELIALVSVWSGAFFSLVILVQWVAAFILTPCMHSP
jgi:hypothetical protein